MQPALEHLIDLPVVFLATPSARREDKPGHADELKSAKSGTVRQIGLTLCRESGRPLPEYPIGDVADNTGGQVSIVLPECERIRGNLSSKRGWHRLC